MPVEVKDYRELRQKQAASEEASRTAQQPQVEQPKPVDLSEYRTENELVNDTLVRLEQHVANLKAVQQDAKDKLVMSLQEPISRNIQIAYWQAQGREQGVRDVLQEIKKLSMEKAKWSA
jgi:hypothetical protein